MIDSVVIFAIVAFVPWMAFAYSVNVARKRRRMAIREESLFLELCHAFINLSVLAFNVIGAFVVFKWIGGFFFG